MNNKHIRYIYSSLIVLFASILLGFILLLITALIPKQIIMENIVKSSVYLKDSPQIKTSLRLKRDNFTEAIMCAIAGNVDDKNPVVSIMNNAYYRQGKPEESFYRHYAHGTKGMRETFYHRYWHGYIVFLRPLFAITDYQGIRYFNYVVFSLVMLTLLYLVNKRHHISVLLSLIAALLYASIYYVPQCLQFSTTFYIAMLGSILFLTYPWNWWGYNKLSCLFIVLGASTSFADLLVTPMVTLGFPLIFVLLQMVDKNCISCQFKTTVGLSTAWFFGYVGMWAAKWGIYALFFAQDGWGAIADKITERSVGGVPSYCTFERFFSHVLWFIPNIKNAWWAPSVVSLIALIINILICLYICNSSAFRRYIILLVVSTIPFAWMLLTYNHTLIHIWFTHRMWSVTVFALLLFVIKTISNKKNKCSFSQQSND